MGGGDENAENSKKIPILLANLKSAESSLFHNKYCNMQ